MLMVIRNHAAVKMELARSMLAIIVLNTATIIVVARVIGSADIAIIAIIASTLILFALYYDYDCYCYYYYL